eukprot:356550-Chlamydomonas_euryale.AAC.6
MFCHAPFQTLPCGKIPTRRAAVYERSQAPAVRFQGVRLPSAHSLRAPLGAVVLYSWRAVAPAGGPAVEEPASRCTAAGPAGVRAAEDAAKADLAWRAWARAPYHSPFPGNPTRASPLPAEPPAPAPREEATCGPSCGRAGRAADACVKSRSARLARAGGRADYPCPECAPASKPSKSPLARLRRFGGRDEAAATDDVGADRRAIQKRSVAGSARKNEDSASRQKAPSAARLPGGHTRDRSPSPPSAPPRRHARRPRRRRRRPRMRADCGKPAVVRRGMVSSGGSEVCKVTAGVAPRPLLPQAFGLEGAGGGQGRADDARSSGRAPAGVAAARAGVSADVVDVEVPESTRQPCHRLVEQAGHKT